ncbi:MAG TPA: hypothetical protein VEG66_00365 [Thermoplasmata archaeon]|jgi:hypothetical protein|nr:hypothetical protein [Thermoplasmata archaeon]
MSDSRPAGRERNAYIGWYASAIFLTATFAAAAVVWFIFHPW